MESDLSVATIRSLGIDMINKANSGHPGMVLGSAPALYTLYTKHLRVNPQDHQWVNRDRFVLASGHASALLYTMLHLSGFDISMDDLKSFRQWASKTPGHPEKNLTPGVDVSSGPLGQGIPAAVGMAIAERFLATKFNKPDLPVFDHYTYVLCGDGDMQEGVSYEASSLAGHLSLDKLIVLYDANNVTLDGPLALSFSENVKKRYEAMGWQVIEINDGNDLDALHKAILKAKRERFKPSMIINHTVIGYGSQNQGTNIVHGNPLGEEDGRYAKQSYGFDHEDFYVPDEVYAHFRRSVISRGKRTYNKWQKMMAAYRTKYPEDYQVLDDALNGRFHFDYDALLKDYPCDTWEATRQMSYRAIQEIAKQNPTYLSGTADLSSSTKTAIVTEERFGVDHYDGRNLYFGIREFAMVCIMNGMTLHGGVKVSGGGFLVFSDYFKAGLRMSGLMQLPIILPLSHDSIAVGEDGPTHQPVEQLAMLRSSVDITVLRPADIYELLASWKIAVESQNVPTAIVLTRQEVPNITKATYDDVRRGAYIVRQEQGPLEGIFIATGSEVQLALEASEQLAKQGKEVRVVSMPSQELFNAQDHVYQEKILPRSCRKRMVIEMASSFGWHRYAGLDGKIMSVDTFGASAPAEEVIKAYGFTLDHVIKNYNELDG